MLQQSSANIAYGLLILLGSTILYLAWKLAALKSDQAIRQAYRLASDTVDEVLFVVSPVFSDVGIIGDWTFVDCNGAAADFWRMQKQDLIGRRISSLCSEHDLPLVMNAYALAVERTYYEDEYQANATSSGAGMRIRRRIASLNGTLAVCMKDMSPPKEFALEMRRMANEDVITTLLNRNWLLEYLPTVLQDTQKKIALLVIDLDKFKDVNDALGHSVGDLLLRVTAMRLKSIINPQDHIVRLGGDEFAIVLTGSSGISCRNEARQTAELINEILRFPLELVSGKKFITTSIGISLFPDDALDTETLLKNAETAMYAAKNDGKADYCFYHPGLSESLKDRLALEQDLFDAIGTDQFMLFFEPRMHVASGRLSGMEALARWHHPERGMVSPQEFIPMAESTGLIVKLGELVIEKTFKQLVAWKTLGLPVVPISINISALQLNAGSLSQTFSNALAAYHVRPELIQIELTESVMLGEQAIVMTELSNIRALGIKELIDDFGTGYSSLSQLQRLKMDILKIDRSFLGKLDQSTEGVVIVKAIISMAHALGMTVVAEGVETREQFEILRTFACDEVQGYLLSKPMSAEAAAEFLTQDEILQVHIPLCS